jgi:hypothetical protein
MEKGKKDFKVGDFISKDYGKDYKSYNITHRYKVGVVKRVDVMHGVGDVRLWCNWADVKKLHMTLEEFVNMEKDRKELWAYESEVEELVMKEKSVSINEIKHIINGTQTIVVVTNEDGTYTRGVSNCHPEDEFDAIFGFEIAYLRALGKEINNITEIKVLCEYSDEEIINELDHRLRKRS